LFYVIQEKYKTELDAMKSAHADSLASQAADCQLLKLQLDNDRIRINQLTKALDNYQQKEVGFTKTHLYQLTIS